MDAKKKKIIIGSVAGVLVIAIAVTCIIVFGGKAKDEKKEDPKPTEAATEQVTEAVTEKETEKETEKATEQATEQGSEGATETIKKASFDDIIKQGYEKIGVTKLYNHIDKYKGKKILTAVQIKDIGNSAVYGTVEKDKKVRAYCQFVFKKREEFKEVKKNEYAAIYGVVSTKGISSGTIEIKDCHIAAVGEEAKAFFDTIKDEELTDPTEKPTSAPATTAPTSAPATAAPTSAPVTQPATSGDNMKVFYDENGVKLGYKRMEKDEFSVNLIVNVENHSGKELMIGTKDSTVNGIPLDLLTLIFIEDGQSDDQNMFILLDDLNEAGITDIEKLTFKLILANVDDFDDTVYSDEITLEL